MLYRLRGRNQRWRVYPRTLVLENRWRAQRYGPTSTLVDFGIGKQVPYADLLDEIIELLREDAEAIGCVAEIEHARDIVARGTSAQRQVSVYEQAIQAGATQIDALKSVVDWLIEETAWGLN